MLRILGIDGGGTKTVAVIANLRGNVLGRGVSGASNYQTVGLDHAIATLKEASEKALAAAGIKKHGVRVACLGLAGVGRETDRALMLPTIKELNLANRIILEHDAAIALAGATACQPGVIVLAGTGSMAFGISKLGMRKRAGGWGNVLGDEGSAYYIGRRALAAACKAYDGRGQKTALVDKLMEYLKLDDFTDLVKKIYHREALPQNIASIAPLVSQLAKSGDKVATEILKDAARELALAANAVINGLDMKDENFQVAVSGSVFNAGKPLLIPFAESVKSTAPRAAIIQPKFEPAIGAVFLALKEAGVEIKQNYDIPSNDFFKS